MKTLETRTAIRFSTIFTENPRFESPCTFSVLLYMLPGMAVLRRVLRTASRIEGLEKGGRKTAAPQLFKSETLTPLPKRYPSGEQLEGSLSSDDSYHSVVHPLNVRCRVVSS